MDLYSRLCPFGFQAVVASGHVGGTHLCPWNYPRQSELSIVNASAGGGSNKEAMWTVCSKSLKNTISSAATGS